MIDDKFSIDEYKFDVKASEQVQKTKTINKWPIVYIINNKNEAYIGETTDAQSRIKQHLSNPERTILNIINIISSGTFNKSVPLEICAQQIQAMFTGLPW